MIEVHEAQTVALSAPCPCCGAGMGTVERWDALGPDQWVVMCVGEDCVTIWEVRPGYVIRTLRGALVTHQGEPISGVEVSA